MLEGRLDESRTAAGSRLLGGPLPHSLSDRILKDVTSDVGRFLELQRSCPVDAKEALRELTCKVADYGDRKDLAAYGEAPLSLPPVGNQSVLVEDVLPPPVAQRLGAASMTLLRDEPDMKSAPRAY